MLNPDQKIGFEIKKLVIKQKSTFIQTWLWKLVMLYFALVFFEMSTNTQIFRSEKY